jgi:hypothetical protein
MNIDIIDLRLGGSDHHWLSHITNRPIRSYDSHLLINKFPVFIVNDFHLNNRFDFFLYLDKNNIKYGLIHTSDENYTHSLRTYFLDSCIFVIRQYYRPTGGISQFLKLWLSSFQHRTIYRYKDKILTSFLFKTVYRMRDISPTSFIRQTLPKISLSKVKFIPLGYLDGFGNIKPNEHEWIDIVDRPIVWSFCGDTSKRDRKPMIKALSKSSSGYVHENVGWMSNKHISPEEYKNIFLRSQFVPCPMGYVNLETARIHEALESGSIPLILKTHSFQPYDYFSSLLGEHPLPAFYNWEEVASFISEIDNISLHNLSVRIRSWWKNYKLDLTIKINEVFNAVQQDDFLKQNIYLPNDFDPSTM